MRYIMCSALVYIYYVVYIMYIYIECCGAVVYIDIALQYTLTLYCSRPYLVQDG